MRAIMLHNKTLIERFNVIGAGVVSGRTGRKIDDIFLPSTRRIEAMKTNDIDPIPSYFSVYYPTILRQFKSYLWSDKW